MKVQVDRLPVVSMALASWLALASTASGTDLDHILFQTIRRGDTESLRSLLRQGTPVDIRTADGTTPLLHAALRGNVESLRLLLEHGAQVRGADRDAGKERSEEPVPRRIDEKYALHVVITQQGDIYTGLLSEKSDDAIVLTDGTGKQTTVSPSDVQALLPQAKSFGS